MGPPQAPGGDLYALLGLNDDCSAEDVKQAYRRRARRMHPDKGGSAAAFAALQAAFDTLCDPARRAVYDAHARRAAAAGPWRGAGGLPGEEFFEVPGGAEAALLRELSRRCGAGAGPGGGGGRIDALTQLVVLCELCGRPATQECWTCGMAMCSFCGRRRHYRGAVSLHWPLVDAPGRMLELLGRQELERKRQEDGRAHLIAQPGARSDAESRVLAEFERTWAAARREARSACGGSAYGGGGQADSLQAELARHYMWAQTDSCVHVAVYDPLGEPKAEPLIEVTSSGLRVGAVRQAAGAAAGPRSGPASRGGRQSEGGGAVGPVLDRRWAHAIDAAAGAASWRGGAGGRLVAVRVAKARPGQAWHSLFQARGRGDSAGARCLVPPYQVALSQSEATLELPLPRWVVPSEDVTVQITRSGVVINIDGAPGGRLVRTFWRPPHRAAAPLVAPEASGWSVAAGAAQGAGEGDASSACGGCGGGRPRQGQKALSVVIAFREAPPEAPGKPDAGDPRIAPREGAVLAGAGKRGWALFVEDEDRFGLAALLQASTFDEAGRAWVAPPPWQPAAAAAGGGRWVSDELQLPAEARAALKSLRSAASQGGGEQVLGA